MRVLNIPQTPTSAESNNPRRTADVGQRAGRKARSRFVFFWVDVGVQVDEWGGELLMGAIGQWIRGRQYRGWCWRDQ